MDKITAALEAIRVAPDAPLNPRSFQPALEEAQAEITRLKAEHAETLNQWNQQSKFRNADILKDAAEIRRLRAALQDCSDTAAEMINETGWDMSTQIQLIVTEALKK